MRRFSRIILIAHVSQVVRNVILHLVLDNRLQRHHGDLFQPLMVRVFKVAQHGRVTLNILDEGRHHVGQVALEVFDGVLTTDHKKSRETWQYTTET